MTFKNPVNVDFKVATNMINYIRSYVYGIETEWHVLLQYVRYRQADVTIPSSNRTGKSRELHGLSVMEIGPGVDLVRLLNYGYLPPIYNVERPLRLLDAYVSQYLMEEA